MRAAARFTVVAGHPVDLPDGRGAFPGEVIEAAPSTVADLLADGHLVPTPAEDKAGVKPTADTKEN